MSSSPWVLLVGALFILPGCATTYVPDADAPSSQLVPDFPPGTRVKLINAQPSTETLLIGEAGMGRSVRGNLHDWTGQVIKAMQSTLKAKGVTVSDNADKSLKVAVTKAALTEAGSGWSFRCTVDFTVETSSGQLATLMADDTSWKYPKRLRRGHSKSRACGAQRRTGCKVLERSLEDNHCSYRNKTDYD